MNVYFVKLYVLKFKILGQVVQKPLKVNPGLKVNRGNNFPSIKTLFIAYRYVLSRLRLIMLKTEGQKI